MNWQEHALAGGRRVVPGLLVGLGNHILPQMWETIQVAGIAQGVVTLKGKGKKRVCVHVQLLFGKGIDKHMHLLMAVVER